MARPRRQTYPLETYLNSIKDGDISNNADTQRKPAWKEIIDGLIVTILTDDYIPPIILAEKEPNTQLDIVDGGSRSAAFIMFRYGNHKISFSVENSIISYKKKNKDKNGNVVWEDATFDIRGKTYEQLPDELKKKFNGYQLEAVVHENCDKNKIAVYIKRYNEHSSMNTNQKAFTYVDKYAKRIRKLMDSKFFIDCNVYSNNDNEKGNIERIIVETLMCVNHFDKWGREAKRLFKYINDHGTEQEFDILEENIDRLGNIITEDIKDIFNKKDSFIFLTLFDKFTKCGVDDEKFANFLREFKFNYRETIKNEKGFLFDEIKKNNSTKNKQVIIDKLDMLENLMSVFLHNTVDTNNCTTTENESFIAEVFNIDINEVAEDMGLYNDTLDDLIFKSIKDGSNSRLVDPANRKSLLAMIVYSYKQDINLDSWFAEYVKKNNMYYADQRKNFLHMKSELKKYIETKEKESG